MKRLLVLFLLLVIAVVGLGYYRGWFQVSTGGTDQNPNATITVDKDKFNKDKEKAVKKVQEAEQYLKEKVQTETKKDKE